MNNVSQRAESAPRSILMHAIVSLVIALPCITLAAPPAHAPAHGWRNKRDSDYTGFSGRQWPDDFGVASGRCNRAALGAALGGFTGGTVGAELTAGEDRAVAIVVGTVIGAAIGAEIGRRMDKTDRSCVGHALELTADDKTVSWTNSSTRVTYQLRPLQADGGEGCRKFRLTAHGAFGLTEGRTIACPDAKGVWDLAPEIRVSSR